MLGSHNNPAEDSTVIEIVVLPRVCTIIPIFELTFIREHQRRPPRIMAGTKSRAIHRLTGNEQKQVSGWMVWLLPPWEQLATTCKEHNAYHAKIGDAGHEKVSPKTKSGGFPMSEV